MKSLRLELVALEDRSTPAVLATHAVASRPLPAAEATVVVVVVAPLPALAVAAAPSQGTPLGKLAANHNQTLVRDRRGRKSRRR